MKREIWIAAVACFSLGLLPGLAAADTQHVSKQVVFLQAPPSDADCFYFQLDGVGTADPVFNGNPWFAIPRSHNGFKELYAMVLAAKLTGTAVDLVTTGTAAGGSCGNYVGVRYVYLP